MLTIDPCCYASRRSPLELEKMATAGVFGIIEPYAWPGYARRSVESALDDFDRLIGPEARRAQQFGLGYGVCVGVTPQDANNFGLAQAILEALPHVIAQERVLAIGEIGLDRCTGTEEEIFRRQVRLARHAGMPIVVVIPPRDRREICTRSLALLREEGVPAKNVLFNGVTDETLPYIREYGCWYGLTIDKHSHIGAERAVSLLQQHGLDGVMLHSAAGRLYGDVLAVPKTARMMLEAGFTREQIEKVTYHNPKWFFSQARPMPLPSSTARLETKGRSNEQASPYGAGVPSGVAGNGQQQQQPLNQQQAYGPGRSEPYNNHRSAAHSAR